MIPHIIGDLFDTPIRIPQQVLRLSQPYLLQILGIGQSCFPFDQPVKIILLKMEPFRQIVDRDIGKMMFYKFRHLLKDDPVHGLAKLSG